MVTIAEIQAALDAYAYPPTHTYRLDPFEPTGHLADRVAILQRLCPDFFTPDPAAHFLDVGASKGYFTILGSHLFGRVVALEPDRATAPVTRPAILLRKGQGDIDVIYTTFRDWAMPDHRFDRVWVGNGQHHLYADASCSWDFVPKLACVCEPDALVLMEGILDGNVPDAAGCIPAEGRPGYNVGRFLVAMTQHFEWIGDEESIAYSPGRRVWAFRRIPGPLDVRAVSLDILGTARSLRQYDPPGHRIYRTVDDRVAKIYATDPPIDWRAVELASYGPRATPIGGGILDSRGSLIGWIEQYVPAATFRHFEEEEAVITGLREQQIFLARNGYVDLDMGTLNWLRDPETGRVRCVDKNATAAVCGAVDPTAQFGPPGDLGGLAVQTIRQSYDRFPAKLLSDLATAMHARNSHAVEAAFATEDKTP